MLEFDKVAEPFWDSKPVVIVGNGTSINGFDLDQLRDRFFVLAVKGRIFQVPWADAGFGLDTPRYDEWSKAGRFRDNAMPIWWAVPKLKFFETLDNTGVRFLRRVEQSMLSEDPTKISSGGSSGFGALNFATLKRAKRILLLGFDYDGDRHPPDPSIYVSKRDQNAHRWLAWAQNFHKCAPQLTSMGVKVINASRDSRIACFPRMDIEAAIEAIHA